MPLPAAAPKRFNLGMEHQRVRVVTNIPQTYARRSGLRGRWAELIKTELVRVADVTCWAPRSGYSPMMFNTVAQIAIPRRGVFALERCGHRALVDANTVVLLGADEEYRVSHPSDDGDDGILLAFAPALLEEAFGTLHGRVGQLQPSHQFAAQVITRALTASELDQLETEDATLLLLASLKPFLTQRFTERGRPLGPAQRLRIDHARALLASSPATRWTLATLGEALGCSPFHLARQFRAVSGETISRYLLRLRLATAVDRLADGESDIAALAVALGFSHHSHFTARFRTAFGITPKRAREIFTRRSFDELRSLVVVP